MSIVSARFRGTLPIAAIAAVVLALTGCQSGPAKSRTIHNVLPSASSSGPADASPPADETATSDGVAVPAAGDGQHACSLITRNEATTALGADPGPGVETTSGSRGICEYGAVPVGIKLIVDPAGGKAIYDGDRATVTSDSPTLLTDVPGVGDGAFATPSGRAITTVYLHKGDTFVEIVLGIDGAAPPKDKAIVLATAAAGRI